MSLRRSCSVLGRALTTRTSRSLRPCRPPATAEPYSAAARASPRRTSRIRSTTRWSCVSSLASSVADMPASLGRAGLRYREPMPDATADVRLRPWAAADLPLLERLLGDAAMTVHLGGPASPRKLRRLHHDYVALRPPTGRMFAITAGDDDTAVGSVGYWLADRGGETFWELGCSIVPEQQGRGYGTRALLLAPQRAWADAPHRAIHAFPSVDNAASNAMCRRAGFTLAGEAEVRVRPGLWMRVYDWMLPALAPRRE